MSLPVETSARVTRVRGVREDPTGLLIVEVMAVDEKDGETIEAVTLAATPSEVASLPGKTVHCVVAR